MYQGVSPTGMLSLHTSPMEKKESLGLADSLLARPHPLDLP